jgi:hypothetical protein
LSSLAPLDEPALGDVLVDVYAPTGSYDPNWLANTGLNY